MDSRKSALGREIQTLKQSGAASAAPLQFYIGYACDYSSECSDQCCPWLPWQKLIRDDRCTLFLKYRKFFCHSIIIEVFALWHRGINPLFLCWLSICLCSVLKVLALWSYSSAVLFFLPYYPDLIVSSTRFTICSVRIERARALLDCSDESIAQIAERLRFCSCKHFPTPSRLSPASCSRNIAAACKKYSAKL